MGVLLSRFVNGNILVLKPATPARQWRWSCATRCSASGGMVVGAVLTRYRSAAPRWLRRWL